MSEGFHREASVKHKGLIRIKASWENISTSRMNETAVKRKDTGKFLDAITWIL